jgi:hypothetical protein
VTVFEHRRDALQCLAQLFVSFGHRNLRVLSPTR